MNQIVDINVPDVVDFKDIPIVMASGMDMSVEAMEAGADKFIIKPFEPSDLPDLFNRLISK